jgi:hypothetical protein
MSVLSVEFAAKMPLTEFRRDVTAEFSALLSGMNYELVEQSDYLLVWRRRYWPLWARLGCAALVLCALIGSVALYSDTGGAGEIRIILPILGLLALVMAVFRRSSSVQLSFEDRGPGTLVRLASDADTNVYQALHKMLLGLDSALVAMPIEDARRAGQGTISTVQQLALLARLRQEGILSEEEYANARWTVMRASLREDF